MSKKHGILLINLGTPEAPTAKALRAYLREFLNDKRVVDLPRWLWWPILYLLILPFRPRLSAKKYKLIWSDKGSPLLAISLAQQAKLQTVLDRLAPQSFQVALGMCYGSPSIKTALKQLYMCHNITILPLYPQYSTTTVASAFDSVAKALNAWRAIPNIDFISSYHDEPSYIDAVTSAVKSTWGKKPRGEKLLISFHGLPQAQVARGDPYYQQCCETAALIANQLQLSSSDWQLVFQSRFGAAKWLTPYCNEVLKQLAAEGTKNVDIICPGFSADCLETLEEIKHTYRNLFIAAGGNSVNYIPVLNDSDQYISCLITVSKPKC